MLKHTQQFQLSSNWFVTLLPDRAARTCDAALCAATPMEDQSVRTDGGRTTFSVRRLMCAMVAFGLLVALGFAQTASAQNSTDQLQFGQNYFVTGDYVVAGVGLRGLGDGSGFAPGTITMPDGESNPSTGVPAGAQIVAAILYWQTVESSQTAFVGQNGYFRGYAIKGVVLGNPNAPVSWSSGGCSGSSSGSKTIRTYRADVRGLLPVDSNGNILAGNHDHPAFYNLRLADSGSNGGGTPMTLGASLVIIYRAIAPALPLNSVVIYDGAVAPSNNSSDMSQTIQGFYEPATNPISKLTHIVGNGQPNKYEQVYFQNQPLASPNGSSPPFNGYYNGSWDNPTWNVGNLVNGLWPGFDTSETTMVVPNSSNGGCVTWGAVIFSTTVQDSDDDGVLDVWKHDPNHPLYPPGYCDASVSGGQCSPSDAAWVPLQGAVPGESDLFVQIDYMCSLVKNDGTCDTTNGNYSFYPPQSARDLVQNAFLQDSSGAHPHNIHVHFVKGNAIQEQTCSDSVDALGNPVLCPYVGQPGIVSWKAGFEFVKNQPLNYPDNLSCDTQTPPGGTAGSGPPCIRAFQNGRKDSYHYVLYAHAIGLPEWSLQDGSLTSVVATGTTVTFTTNTPHGLTTSDRVTITGAITNFSLNGTYMVSQSLSANTFSIQIPTATYANYTQATDPRLLVSSGRVGTTSGYSDIGGADSLITLGLWGPDGQAVNVQAGTLMHELGHSLGLTHGGSYYDTPGTYFSTFGPNCKPNYQSVMSYLFQVDLFNDRPDYSEQPLDSLDENSLPGSLTPVPVYSTTKWYTPTPPFGVGTMATHHCDGTPLSPLTDPYPTMYRVEGPAYPTITPSWGAHSDVNFDGITETNLLTDNPLRGYYDWGSIDLRQIGATGSDIASPGFGTTGAGFGTTGAGFGTTGAGFGEINRETANSVTRPPRKLTATPVSSPSAIQLNWTAPTFGQIASYNIYRGVGTGVNPAPPPYKTVSGSQPSYLDKSISCGATYSYFVTALLSNGQESVPSNMTTVVKCGK